MKKDEKAPLDEGKAQATPETGAVVDQETPEAQQPEATQENNEPEAGTETEAAPEPDQTSETQQATDGDAPEAGEGTEGPEAQQPEEKPAVVAYAIRVDEAGHTYLESGNIKSETETTVEFIEGFTANKKDVFADHDDAYAEIDIRTKR